MRENHTNVCSNLYHYNGIPGIPQSHDYCNDITAVSLTLDSTSSEQCSSLQNKLYIRPSTMSCWTLDGVRKRSKNPVLAEKLLWGGYLAVFASIWSLRFQ